MRRRHRHLGANGRAILIFELLYKAVSLAVLTPLFYALTALALRAYGTSYLSAANFLPFLRAPVTIALAAVLLAAAAFQIAYDLSAVLYGLDCSRRGAKTNVYDIARTGLHRTGRLLRRGAPLLLVYLLLILPLLSFGTTAGLGSVLSLPDISGWLLGRHKTLRIAVKLLRVPQYLGGLCCIYALHFACLTGTGVRESLRGSFRLVRRHPLTTAAAIAAWNAVYLALYSLAGALGIAIARIVCGAFLKVELLYAVTLSFSVTFLVVLTVLFLCMTVPASLAVISGLFYRFGKKDGMPPLPAADPPRQIAPEKRTHARRAIAIIGILSVFACFVYVNAVRAGYVGLSPSVTVTAHRGDSLHYPENTLYAFQGAVDLGADCIELDVQQTRDGVLIVQHDPSMRRTTGLKKNVWELDYADMQDLDCGSWFGKEFSDARIPTLAETIEFAKDADVRLNIELKPTGHETDFAASVAALIREMDFTDRCIVTSMSYDTLTELKAADPDLTTAYVMSVAYGRVTDLVSADEFSVRSSFVTRPLAWRIHSQDKLLHVWTVNTEGAIERMLDLGADDLITDNVVLAQELVAEQRSGDLIRSYVARITGRGDADPTS